MRPTKRRIPRVYFFIGAIAISTVCSVIATPLMRPRESISSFISRRAGDSARRFEIDDMEEMLSAPQISPSCSAPRPHSICPLPPPWLYTRPHIPNASWLSPATLPHFPASLAARAALNCRALSMDPPMYFIESALTSHEAEELLAYSDPRLYASLVTGSPTKPSTVRTSMQLYFSRDKLVLPVSARLRRRFSRLLGVPPTHFEALQVLKYEDGQYYKSHHDGSLRQATALLWLSDVGYGGGTEFASAVPFLTRGVGDSASGVKESGGHDGVGGGPTAGGAHREAANAVVDALLRERRGEGSASSTPSDSASSISSSSSPSAPPRLPADAEYGVSMDDAIRTLEEAVGALGRLKVTETLLQASGGGGGERARVHGGGDGGSDSLTARLASLYKPLAHPGAIADVVFLSAKYTAAAVLEGGGSAAARWVSRSIPPAAAAVASAVRDQLLGMSEADSINGPRRAEGGGGGASLMALGAALPGRLARLSPKSFAHNVSVTAKRMWGGVVDEVAVESLLGTVTKGGARVGHTARGGMLKSVGLPRSTISHGREGEEGGGGGGGGGGSDGKEGPSVSAITTMGLSLREIVNYGGDVVKGGASAPAGGCGCVSSWDEMPLSATPIGKAYGGGDASLEFVTEEGVKGEAVAMDRNVRGGGVEGGGCGEYVCNEGGVVHGASDVEGDSEGPPPLSALSQRGGWALGRAMQPCRAVGGTTAVPATDALAAKIATASSSGTLSWRCGGADPVVWFDRRDVGVYVAAAPLNITFSKQYWHAPHMDVEGWREVLKSALEDPNGADSKKGERHATEEAERVEDTQGDGSSAVADWEKVEEPFPRRNFTIRVPTPLAARMASTPPPSWCAMSDSGAAVSEAVDVARSTSAALLRSGGVELWRDILELAVRVGGARPIVHKKDPPAVPLPPMDPSATFGLATLSRGGRCAGRWLCDGAARAAGGGTFVGGRGALATPPFANFDGRTGGSGVGARESSTHAWDLFVVGKGKHAIRLPRLTASDTPCTLNATTHCPEGAVGGQKGGCDGGVDASCPAASAAVRSCATAFPCSDVDRLSVESLAISNVWTVRAAALAAAAAVGMKYPSSSPAMTSTIKQWEGAGYLTPKDEGATVKAGDEMGEPTTRNDADGSEGQGSILEKAVGLERAAAVEALSAALNPRPLRAMPRRLCGVIFYSLNPDGSRISGAAHAAMVPFLNSTKWVANFFVDREVSGGG